MRGKGSVGWARARVGATALLGALALGSVAAQVAASASLPDSRGWGMVSPVDKNGGQVDLPGTFAGGGVLQAAAGGGAITYSSSSSFGDGAQGAPAGSQYIARRGSNDWSTENITTPLLSGSYGAEPNGVPYQFFSSDLARGLLLNGSHCRGGGEGCAVPNPPLPGTGAPAGFQNYYLRDNTTGSFEALVGDNDLGATSVGPAQFDLALAGANPELRHVVLSTCAALTSDAVEVVGADPESCDATLPNLYEWSAGQLSLLNFLPGEAQGTPGAALAAQAGAVSADGSRVYWTDGANLYLRAGGQTKQVDTAAGGGGTFQTAAADGSVAFFTKGEHLWRYDAGNEVGSDLTPSGGVQGVLGASDDGSYVYYLTMAGLFLRQGATTTKVADTADSSNYPPTTGTARVSADGTHLAFVANAGVYLYDAVGPTLVCASCRSSGPPIGPSTIPGAIPNGKGLSATDSYKPRALSADGRRLFFDSKDALVVTDTNAASDVYEWEAQNEGSCIRASGCVALISSGRAKGGAFFVDASADGSDAFFLTDDSLVASDPGSIDLYDARVGGGFTEPPEPIPCEGDACQSLPPEPVDPVLNTLITGLGNPPVHYAKPRRHRRAHPHPHPHPHRHRHRHHRHRGHRGGKR